MQELPIHVRVITAVVTLDDVDFGIIFARIVDTTETKSSDFSHLEYDLAASTGPTALESNAKRRF
jgi:hypothetical protein